MSDSAIGPLHDDRPCYRVELMIKKSIKIMGFGTFDGLHPGHVSYLKQLRDLGDELIVIVARDKNIKKIKGQKPHFNEHERLEAVQKTSLADQVFLGDERHFYQCLLDHRPDTLGLGYDQHADLDYLAKHFPTVRIVRLEALKPHVFKTSFLKALRTKD